VTPEEFVEILRLIAVEQSAEATLKVLRQPPGRNPWPEDVRRSQWFNSLDDPDQEMVAEVARSAAFLSTFSFCNILDGTKVVDPDHGSLRLLYVAPHGTETVLNDPERCEPS
jgi:hypothetical protein